MGLDVRKPSLNTLDQIAHLKQKGVRFELCSEEDAARYLNKHCNFFKVSAYRKLFAKYVGGKNDGKYLSLDFAQLRLLASLDQRLREVVLRMTLDIEHFQKISLLSRMEQEGEDGYSIVRDYLESLDANSREHRQRELRLSGLSPYSKDLCTKYADDMPAWVFFELTSFGTLVDFVRYCGERWGDRKLRASHYDLKQVKSLRNGAAHGSCILNQLANKERSRYSVSRKVQQALSQLPISKSTRKKWLSNGTIQEIVTTLVVYSQMVPTGRSRSNVQRLLTEFFSAVALNSNLLPTCGPDAIVGSSLVFLETLTRDLKLIEF